MVDTSAELIRRMEGFRATPYYDNNAWRVGYGSDTITLPDGSVQQVTQGMQPITREDAERDLERRIPEFQQQGVIRYIGQETWDRLPPETQAALTSVAYNYGSLAGLPSIVRAAQSGDANQLAMAVANRAADNDGQNANRRNQEAALIAGHPIPPADIPLPSWVQAGGAVGRGQLQDNLSPPIPAQQSPALQNNRDHPLEQPAPLQPNLNPILSAGSPALQAAKARLAAAKAATGRAGGGDAAKPVDTSKPAPVYSIAANAPGMVAPGNINLNARPVDRSMPGTYRTEESISIGTDAGEVLIPTVINGQKVSNADAIKHYQQTGENLGTFTNAAAADTYAQQLHERQAQYYAPASWITSNQPNSTKAPAAQPAAESPANPLRNDAWANIVATPSAKPYTGNEPNYVGREVPLPAGYDLPVPQIGNTLGTGTTKTANGISGTVQMPAGARPTSVPTIAPWLPGAKAPSGSALPSKAPWLPMGAALPIDGTTMIAQPIVGNFLNSPPATPVTGPTVAATPIKPSEDVRAVQSALKQAGYNIATDGLMGPQTDAAIRAFQKANGLVVDGIVGPKTSIALQRSLPVNSKTNPLLGVTFGLTTPAPPTTAPWITANQPAAKAPVVVQKTPQQTTAEQHYAQTGTYADNDPSNNAKNFERNANGGFSDFLSGGL